MKSNILATVLFSLWVLSPKIILAEKHDHDHGHGAHEHGVANLDIAVEGKKITIEFRSPAETIYGFEHEAKKPADIKKRDEGAAKLQKISDLIKFDAKAECSLKLEEVEAFVTEGDDEHGHGETHAKYSGECKNSLKGTSAEVLFGKSFGRLLELKVQIVSDDKQTGVELKRGKGKISF